MATYKAVFIRHGESLWNKKNLFTGWANVSLTEKGINDAIEAGKTLKKNSYTFDTVFTNMHKRSIKTAKFVLRSLGLGKMPFHKAWQLNERHYGALIGLNKSETAKKYGDAQVLLWRRSYSTRPPALEKTDRRYKSIKAAYPDIPAKYLPLTESLEDTYKRVVPYWKDTIVPAIKKGKKVVIVASHNSLRSLIKYIDGISDEEIVEFTIPTSVPLVYEFDGRMRPIGHHYIGNPAQIKKALAAIAAQGRSK